MKNSEVKVIRQYIKDLSFENPMAPSMPTKDENPSINLDINTIYKELKNEHHEINLKIKSTASYKDVTLFIIELQYAGLFIAKLKDEEEKKSLIISSSYLLFPFARTIINNITMEGGFKSLMIQPIKFENIFQK